MLNAPSFVSTRLEFYALREAEQQILKSYIAHNV